MIPHRADPADLELALTLADEADRITTAAFRRPDLAIETKPDMTPVTEADKAVELAIRAELARSRPDDIVLGEEYGGEERPGARRWVIDPIDATKNFVRGIPIWATLLALEVDGRIEIGVVSAPALGRRWWAARGLGAHAGPPTAPIQVSAIKTLGDAQLSGAGLTAWHEAGDDRQAHANAVALALQCGRDRDFGDFWSHMLVAEGACEIALDPIVSVWDVAAVQVIVEEAGGRFTDLEGHARADGGSGISTNGHLHETVLSILLNG
jgi:histidinol-phosphatase